MHFLLFDFASARHDGGVKAGIALGSNLGNRARHIGRGFAFLRTLSGTGHFLQSSLVETEPVDCPAGSESFLNAAAEIEWAGTPRALFDRLKAFELEEGDRKSERNAPRHLDLDLLYLGDWVLGERDLIVPHPRMLRRDFVLRPLAEIVPGLVLPGQSRSVQEFLDALLVSR